jgi:uncharacterized membrane protein YagU involved in acid resistance
MARANTIWLAILLGGLIAGTIDVGAAALIYLKDPVAILHNIAAGLLGKASFTGGMATALLGLVLQWAMSILIAAIFVYGTRLIPVLARMWIVGGLLYGVAVFFVMEYVVVPLSAIHRVPHFTPTLFVENVAAMLLFGLIVAYCGRSATA